MTEYLKLPFNEGVTNQSSTCDNWISGSQFSSHTILFFVCVRKPDYLWKTHTPKCYVVTFSLGGDRSNHCAAMLPRAGRSRIKYPRLYVDASWTMKNCVYCFIGSLGCWSYRTSTFWDTTGPKWCVKSVFVINEIPLQQACGGRRGDIPLRQLFGPWCVRPRAVEVTKEWGKNSEKKMEAEDRDWLRKERGNDEREVGR